jgi:hypothetical protein
MCLAIKDGGVRCDGHAVQKKNRAAKAYAENPTEANRMLALEAIQDWKLTEAGLKNLQEKADKESDAEKRASILADLERCERIRASKLKWIAEVRAKNRKESGKPSTIKEKLALAGSPETDPETHQLLASDKNMKVRVAVASNSTDSGVLETLWTDKEPAVLNAVARNDHADGLALESLFSLASKHAEQGSIRLGLAQNPSCPSSLYLPLANTGSTQIRKVLASKEDIDAATLEVIAEDKFPATRKAAGSSPNGSRKVFVTLGCQDPETFVRSAVAQNRAVPADILAWIQQNDSDWHIREQAAETLSSLAAREEPKIEKN